MYRHAKKLLSELEKSEFQMQFNGEADLNSCYLEIHAGAGGTESQDWAQMLQECTCAGQNEKNFNSK